MHWKQCLRVAGVVAVVVVVDDDDVNLVWFVVCAMPETRRALSPLDDWCRSGGPRPRRGQEIVRALDWVGSSLWLQAGLRRVHGRH